MVNDLNQKEVKYACNLLISCSFRGFQRTMVKSMTMAAKVPHFHFVEEINCDALVELKESFQSSNSDSNVKHTFLPSLIKTLSMAISKYPLVNSCFTEESLEVILKGLYISYYLIHAIIIYWMRPRFT